MNGFVCFTGIHIPWMDIPFLSTDSPVPLVLDDDLGYSLTDTFWTTA
jgi:hypothetical protein